MNERDNAKLTAAKDIVVNKTPREVEARRRQVHQRIEQLNEERRLKRLLGDEWDD